MKLEDLTKELNKVTGDEQLKEILSDIERRYIERMSQILSEAFQSKMK